MFKKATSYLLLILLISSCQNNDQNLTVVQKYYELTTAQTGTISKEIDYTGELKSFNSTLVASKIPGKLSSLEFSAGDFVEKDQLLATLEGQEFYSQLDTSQEVLSAVGNLKESTNAMFDQQIEVAQLKVNQAQTAVEVAEISLQGASSGLSDTENVSTQQLVTIEKQIDELETTIEFSEQNFLDTKEVLIQKRTNLYNNAKSALSQSIVPVTSSFTFLDEIGGVTDEKKSSNDLYDKYLGTKNTELKNQAKNNFTKLYPRYEQFIADYEEKIVRQAELDEVEINQFLLESYQFLLDLKDMLNLAFNVVDNSIEAPAFTLETINNLKEDVSTLAVTIENTIMSVEGNFVVGIKGMIDNISQFNKESQLQLDSLAREIDLYEKQLETLEQTYKQTQAVNKGKITDITTQRHVQDKQLELAQQQLAEANNSLASLQEQKKAALAEIASNQSQTQGQIAQSEVSVDNTMVKAPFAGVITEKLVEVWQVVNAGTPLARLATDKELKIEVAVPFNIASQLQVGQEVKVLVAWQSESTLAKVFKVLPTSDAVSKKTLVEIKMDNSDFSMRIGATAKVYFQLPADKKGIVLPREAIVSKYMQPMVVVVDEDKKVQFKMIEILEQTDEEVLLSWLEAGEEVMIKGQENVHDGEVLDNK